MQLIESKQTNAKLTACNNLTHTRTALIRLGQLLTEDGAVFDNPQMLIDHIPTFKKDFEDKLGTTFTDDEALMGAMVTAMAEDLPVEDRDCIPMLMIEAIIRRSKVYRGAVFKDNPYYKEIHLKNARYENIEITEDSYDPFELTAYDTIVGKNSLMIPRVCIFDHAFTFPVFKKGGETWISVSPYVINSMADSIGEAEGNVLLLGAGMGYWPFMAAGRPEVKHITVVENDPDLVKVFKDVILPQFPESSRDKIELVQADPLDHIKATSDGKYDYCFAAPWANDSDTTPYIKIKTACRKFKKTRAAFWIEDALASYLAATAYHVMQREWYVNHGQTERFDSTLDNLPKDERFRFDFLSDLLKNVKIDSPEKIGYYMDQHNIIKLMS